MTPVQGPPDPQPVQGLTASASVSRRPCSPSRRSSFSTSPTVGLDPLQIIEIRDLIRSLGKAHTVLLSSHISVRGARGVRHHPSSSPRAGSSPATTPDGSRKRFAAGSASSSRPRRGERGARRARRAGGPDRRRLRRAERPLPPDDYGRGRDRTRCASGCSLPLRARESPSWRMESPTPASSRCSLS